MVCFEYIDFFDLINESLSFRFVDKWRFRFGERFVKLFQLKLLEYLDKSKRIKKSTLKNYLVKKGKYREELVDDFFNEIDIELYQPFIY